MTVTPVFLRSVIWCAADVLFISWSFIHHRQDGNIKIPVYRKPPHTKQYLLCTEHKLSVTGTLYEQATIIKEGQDKQEEEKRIQHTLTHCQYLKWVINTRRQQIKNKEMKTKTKKTQKRPMTNQYTSYPYHTSGNNRINTSVFSKKHQINTVVKPHPKTQKTKWLWTKKIWCQNLHRGNRMMNSGKKRTL